MRRRFEAKGIYAAFAIASAAALAAGCGLSENEEAILDLSIRQETTFATKAGGVALPDTNLFVLQINNASGESVYNGLYGARPQKIAVPAGTYELSLVSQKDPAPAWDNPVYGDNLSVVAASGEKVSVSFLCKMMNAGVKVNMTPRYISKYPGTLTVSQEEGSLDYTSAESRYGYFDAGNATFTAVAGDGSQQKLFSKLLSAGQMLTLTLDTGTLDSEGTVTVQLDTSATYLSQTILVDEYQDVAGDGLSSATAYSIAQAAAHPDETVWVWGYIVGGDLSGSGIKFEAPFTKNSNIAIAASPVCTTRDECAAVELASGSDLRESVNLVDHPERLGSKIYIKGTITASYFDLTGIKSVKDFVLE